MNRPLHLFAPLLASLLAAFALPHSAPALVQGEEPNPLPLFRLEEEGQERTDAIHDYLQNLEKEGVLSGAVLIATDEEIWYERAYGLASREFNVPNALTTRFDVGSFNKDYTRLAVMQLVENELLGLDDTVGIHLPDYPNERVREEVTLRQLIDHRSGLPDYFDEDYFKTPMKHLREVQDYIPIWGPKPLLYKPGTREEYSNYGYTVLGAVIEGTTQMRYPDYVAEFIFEPAGMKSTGFFDTDGIDPNVAVGYTYLDDEGRPSDRLRKNIYHEPSRGGPWGKSYSPLRDLYAFYDSLYKGELLGLEHRWWNGGWKGAEFLAGGGPGMSSVLLIEDGLVIMVLTNFDMPGAEQIGMRLLEALR